jgi:hypothetical protein
MWEMESQDLFLQGKISGQEREAVRNINGHSSAVTRDYYLLNDRMVDVKQATAVTRLLASPSNGELIKYCFILYYNFILILNMIVYMKIILNGLTVN